MHTRRNYVRAAEGEPVFLGLRSHILDTDDVAATKAWYTQMLGHGPYFDKPFYVGFSVGGYELGIMPRQDPPMPIGGEAYWGVSDIGDTWDRLLAHGAEPASEITDVGEGILMAVVLDPAGNRIGIISNPHFKLE